MKQLLVSILLVFSFIPLGVSGVEPAQELDWDSLIPADFRPDKIIEQLGNFSDLEDDDPQVQAIMQALEKAWNEAPVVESLDGKRVKLPGYVVPLEGDGTKLSEFLLVPYYGACIHVPPPPANQTVYVKVPKKDAKIRQAFDTVWVTGTMSAKPFTSDLATAGYQIEAEEVTPYE
jgi:hypothetical protein